MRCASHNLLLELPHGDLLRLEQARGWRLCCHQGTLMLSGLAPMGDVELAPGQSYGLADDGLVLAEAWGHCRLSLLRPAQADSGRTWRQILREWWHGEAINLRLRPPA